MFVSGNNGLAGLGVNMHQIHPIAEPNEYRFKKGQWFVKTHEIVKPLSKGSRSRLLAKIIFKTLFSLGFCWLAESTKREAAFYKAGKKVVPIYSPLVNKPIVTADSVIKQDEKNALPPLEDVGKGEDALPGPITFKDCHKITDAGLAHLAQLSNLQMLDLANAGDIYNVQVQQDIKKPLAELDIPDQIVVVDKNKGMQDPIIQAVVADIGLKELNLANAKMPALDFPKVDLSNVVKLLPVPNAAQVPVQDAAHLNNKDNEVKAGQGDPAPAPISTITKLQQFVGNAFAKVQQLASPVPKQVAEFAYPIQDPDSIDDEELKKIVAQNPNITSINLSKTKITPWGLAHLQALKHLRELDLSFCKMKNDLSVLKEFKSLETLKLKSQKITSERFAEIGKITTLKRLTISNCDLDVKGIAGLKGLTGLQELDLNHGFEKINDEFLSHLAGFKDLRKLNLDCCNGTDAGLAVIKNFENLEELDLSTNDKITNTTLTYLKDLKKLRFLALQFNHKITDEGLDILAEIESLETLNLTGCNLITKSDLAKLSKLKNLRTLIFQGNKITIKPIKAAPTE